MRVEELLKCEHSPLILGEPLLLLLLLVPRAADKKVFKFETCCQGFLVA